MKKLEVGIIWIKGENDDVDKPGLNEAANETSDHQKTILLIRRYQDIIKTQN